MPMCILYCILQIKMLLRCAALAAVSGYGGVSWASRGSGSAKIGLKRLMILPGGFKRGSRYFPEASRVCQEGNPETGRCRKPRKIVGFPHIALIFSFQNVKKAIIRTIYF